MKDKCRTCPCFQVSGCDECPYFDGLACWGWYPPECTAEDCINVKLENKEEPIKNLK